MHCSTVQHRTNIRRSRDMGLAFWAHARQTTPAGSVMTGGHAVALPPPTGTYVSSDGDMRYLGHPVHLLDKRRESSTGSLPRRCLRATLGTHTAPARRCASRTSQCTARCQGLSTLISLPPHTWCGIRGSPWVCSGVTPKRPHKFSHTS